MSNPYLRSFVIGSSFPVFLPFFLAVLSIDNSLKNYSYSIYSIIAPLYFGLMYALSLLIGNRLGWDLRKRLLIVGLISPIIVFLFGKITNSYNFGPEQWLRYLLVIFLGHLITFNFTIYLIEKYL